MPALVSRSSRASTGGYQIVPPSGGYAIRDDTLPAEMPQWLVTACLKPEPLRPPPRSCRPPLDGDGTPYGLKALSEECIAIQKAPFGKKEITLNNAALKIGGLVAGRELAEGYALAEMIAAGNAMPNESGREPWDPAEIAKKVRRAFADGAQSPRSAPSPIFASDRRNQRQQRDADKDEPQPTGRETYSHFWRSKDFDWPCTPTGEEHRDEADGRIYARVKTPEGTEHTVPKDELFPAQGNGAAGGEDDEPPGGSEEKPTPLTLPVPLAPVAVARHFIESRCLHNGDPDALTLRYWCGSWWTWQTSHWVEAQPREVRSSLYKFTADAVYLDPKDENKTKPWSPNRYKINDLSTL